MDFPATKADVHNAATRVIKANLVAQITSLKARSEAARNFCMNNNMRIEADLCDAQILALTTQLKRYV